MIYLFINKNKTCKQNFYKICISLFFAFFLRFHFQLYTFVIVCVLFRMEVTLSNGLKMPTIGGLFECFVLQISLDNILYYKNHSKSILTYTEFLFFSKDIVFNFIL